MVEIFLCICIKGLQKKVHTWRSKHCTIVQTDSAERGKRGYTKNAFLCWVIWLIYLLVVLKRSGFITKVQRGCWVPPKGWDVTVTLEPWRHLTLTTTFSKTQPLHSRIHPSTRLGFYSFPSKYPISIRNLISLARQSKRLKINGFQIIIIIRTQPFLALRSVVQYFCVHDFNICLQSNIGIIFPPTTFQLSLPIRSLASSLRPDPFHF